MSGGAKIRMERLIRWMFPKQYKAYWDRRHRLTDEAARKRLNDVGHIRIMVRCIGCIKNRVVDVPYDDGILISDISPCPDCGMKVRWTHEA